MSAELLDRARAGDGEAFAQLIDPHRRELQLHCYRILGSLQDAEDALQETMLTAWQSLGGFEERASLRTWLYRVATTRCLNFLRAASRRPRTDVPMPAIELPEPTGQGEVLWLEPYPDTLLEGAAGEPPGPEARYEATEAISLAFVTALQVLPPRQRAVLVLRDVLGFHATEVAEMLDTSVESVTSALRRARFGLQRRLPVGAESQPPTPGSAAERQLVERLTRAYESGDVRALVALLTDDVVISMPPVPLEYRGRAVAARFHATATFREGRTFDLVWTRANGQLAYSAYVRQPEGGVRHTIGLLVLTLTGDRISAMTRFDTAVLARFGLPRTLPG
jgi:RNA polymerase sigma-70 factor (ECF subfamily)